MKKQEGFTVIEIIVVIAFLGLITTLFFIQRADIAASERDDQRKVSINAIYYSLEEDFFTKNGHYPVVVDRSTLRSVDPNLFTDPNGFKIGDPGSSFRYSGENCEAEKCKSYTLRANLEREDDFVKTNRIR